MIIGISGKIGSGKDTVGKIIQYLTLDDNVFSKRNVDIIADLQYKGYYANKSEWKIKKFADKLKDIVCLLINCTREQLEDAEFKNKELGEEWNIPLQEEFKDIIGYEGLYQISNFGRIKSLSRITRLNNIIKESIRSLHIGTNGYYACTLNKNGVKKTKMIHQLVAEVFLNNTPNGYNCVINHIDKNKLNNKIDNLEIVSSRFNTQYSKTTNGVYYRNNKYEVSIRIKNKKTFLGSYKTEKEAIDVRNKKLKEIDTFIPIKYINKQWTPRILLQILGTSVGRQIIHPNIWVNSLMSDYKATVPYPAFKRLMRDITRKDKEYPNWIITDMRFPNELEAVKKRGGISIRVFRNIDDIDKDRNPRVYDEPEHPSETALDNAEFDYTINNNGTIEELIEKVNEFLIQFKII